MDAKNIAKLHDHVIHKFSGNCGAKGVPAFFLLLKVTLTKSAQPIRTVVQSSVAQIGGACSHRGCAIPRRLFTHPVNVALLLTHFKCTRFLTKKDKNGDIPLTYSPTTSGVSRSGSTVMKIGTKSLSLP